MTRQSLTLLQRAVLRRLREHGQATLADRADSDWSDGRPCDVAAATAINDAALRGDFLRANGHARTEE